MNATKRLQNEKKFKQWEELSDGGRRYYYEVKGRIFGYARYIKVVNANEETIYFGQEIYDASHNLVEVHQKFPEDTGHRKV